ADRLAALGIVLCRLDVEGDILQRDILQKALRHPLQQQAGAAGDAEVAEGHVPYRPDSRVGIALLDVDEQGYDAVIRGRAQVHGDVLDDEVAHHAAVLEVEANADGTVHDLAVAEADVAKIAPGFGAELQPRGG